MGVVQVSVVLAGLRMLAVGSALTVTAVVAVVEAPLSDTVRVNV